MSLAIEVRALTWELSILYVEDEKEPREQTINVLKKLFQDIDVATNGIEALELFNTKHFDLIITDIMMPKMDGLELSKLVREKNREQHIVIISAYNQANYLQDAIKIGVDGFIIKPIETIQFLTILKKIATTIKEKKENSSYRESLEMMVEKRTKELEEKQNLLEQQLITDDLTKLYNKKYLLDFLKQNITKTLMLINIDNFSNINSAYGYEIGDEVLLTVAKFLKEQIENGYIFRLYADTFVTLFFGNIDAEKIAKDLNYLAFNNIFTLPSSLSVRLSFSISISITNGDSNRLLEAAQIAMKDIKSSGKNRVLTYNDSIIESQKKHRENIYWMNRTKEALDKGEIVPFFQPIYDIKSEKIYKFEVLARIINSEDNKIITPNFFIEPAKLVGLIPNLTQTIIEKSFLHFKDTEYEFSINITEEDLKDSYLIDFLSEVSIKYSINPERVTLEILEGISVYGSDYALYQLDILKELGYKIALDDFGAEHANFSRMLDLKVDFIKIDGRFIKNIDKDLVSYQISDAITNLAKKLGCKVVAEFVHSEDVFSVVKNIGIDYAQGYFISVPLKSIKEINK